MLVRGSSPRAVLFDVGNVIVRWDPRTLYSKIFDDPAERDYFLAEVCTMAWHTEADRGRPFAEGVRILSRAHPKYAAEIAAWWSRWPEMFSGVIAETAAAIESLHARGVPLFGLTNMSVEAWPGVRAMSPVFSRFADVVVSGAEGVVKPDPEIFHIACRRSGLAPADLLFVDDSAANIAAADALGFHTHHFEEPAALGRALREHALL